MTTTILCILSFLAGATVEANLRMAKELKDLKE